jgi:hypothetical protein
MGGLCGSAKPVQKEVTVAVHGDILQPDVRSALAVLKICEINHNFLGLEQVSKGNDPVLSMAKTSPIIEEKPSGKKYLGATHEVLMEACQRD